MVSKEELEAHSARLKNAGMHEWVTSSAAAAPNTAYGVDDYSRNLERDIRSQIDTLRHDSRALLGSVVGVMLMCIPIMYAFSKTR